MEGITKENLIRYITEKEGISEAELAKRISFKPSKAAESIPIEAFNTNLSPLEAASRFMKDSLGKRIGQISEILGKHPSAVSFAYKSSLKKKFSLKHSEYSIPLDFFRKNRKLSVLEAAAAFLRSKSLSIAEISRILKRSPKTIWTLNKRAEKKGWSL